VPIWSGVAPLPGPGAEPPAGWDEASAEAAGVGEAIERWQSWPLPCDQRVDASFRDWPLDEPAVAPERWVLFHPEQYALSGFPYRPFVQATVCRWVCCRQAFLGSPVWVPEELVYLSLPRGRCAQLCPLVSSGLSCGRWGQPVLLRGLQEVIERDGVVGATWGRYPLEEYDPARIFAGLYPGLPPRLLRPNLRYRFYRVGTPFSAHVTVVTLEGEDRAGYCFSVGAACRETRTASWRKSLLEAVQGRHYVRYLKDRLLQTGDRPNMPASFAEHALYYSV
jgi:ribosomal protein S12 methylthiotransferase accessory factor